MSVYRVLVTGSRSITEEQAAFVRAVLHRECSALVANLRPVVVVQGECPYGGVDLVAREWAEAAPGVESEGHPADWARLGKRAGMVRNSQMVFLGADICLAFPAPDSRGTWDCLTKAAKAGIHTRIYPLIVAVTGCRPCRSETTTDHHEADNTPAPDSPTRRRNP